MRQKIFICAGIVLLCATASAQNLQLPAVFRDAEKQTDVMLQEIPAAKTVRPELVSPRTLDSGRLKMVASRDWTSGFFPGELWLLYEYTGKNEWKQKAESFTAEMEREKTNGGTHDMGFKIFCSFGNGYRLTKNPAYKDIIIQS